MGELTGELTHALTMMTQRYLAGIYPFIIFLDDDNHFCNYIDSIMNPIVVEIMIKPQQSNLDRSGAWVNTLS